MLNPQTVLLFVYLCMFVFCRKLTKQKAPRRIVTVRSCLFISLLGK